MIYEKIKLYEDRADVTLTTYVHSDSPELLNGKKRPAVLVCPGGAYLTCSDREGEPVALRFASMGYHAFVLRYSTYMGGGFSYPDPTKEIPVNPKSIYPNPMRDIAKAILFIRDHSNEWLVDTEKIILCGFSAGAHNCAMYSVYWNDPDLSRYFNVSSEELKPAAAILGYMLSDLIFQRDFVFKQESLTAKHLFESFSVAYTGMREPDDETLKRISPVLYVSEFTPPMFLWTTAQDELVSVEHTILMAKALAEKNIPFEMHIFEEGQHGLSLAHQATARHKDQINPIVAKWIDFAEQWLLRRFSLDLQEKEKNF